MNDASSIAMLDRASVLHPATHLKDYASGKIDPTIISAGDGIRIQDMQGRSLIDGFAGLYCVNIGYGRTEVAEAIARQAYKLAYYHTFAAHTSEPLAILSDRLVRMAPGKPRRVFYGLSGSDANETQAKLVWYYNNLRGQPKKKKIISRQRGFHGSSVIAGSMTGMSYYHDNMDLPVSQVLHTGAPHHYWGSEPGETEEVFSRRRADELEQLILREGPETIGAFIGEPVLGTGGIIPPPANYWRDIQSVLKRYDVLLIADEVVCGFGRTGADFGSTMYGMEPDLVTVAKGLTAGYAPLSGVIIGERVHAIMEEAAERVGPFSHGYTYTGHPISAAAANAVLDIVEKEKLAERARTVGAYFQMRLKEKFAQLEIVGEVRGVGLLGAVEFVADRNTKRRFDPQLKVGPRISKAARDRGLIARAMPHGDILGFAPPLIVSESDIDEIVEIAYQATRQVMDELAK
ncbi:MAG: aminotransferase class III-fold pyridoxal phosphate-dependent enzyme [Rhizobiales bacterium]|nr:aminotransferase class III-fold pyridoxal phosphate-dependent enzyme [Hyphomicrobiales bacterium]